jgi:hypothetical protein
MRTIKSLALPTLVLALGLMNGGCMLIPEIQDRIVELAVGGATEVEFVSSGTLNTFNEANTLDVLSDFNLAQILDDAGVEVSNVTNIKISGVDYRVTIPDPEAAREIVNGTITTDRNGSGPLPLVSHFSAGAGAPGAWQPAPLDPGGAAVTDLNAMLQSILNALKLGTSPPSNLTTITYQLTGQSLPGNVPTNFTWQMKVKITITGTVTVSVPT